MSVDTKKIGRSLKVFAVVLGMAFVGMSIIAKKKRAGSVYDDEPREKNPMAGKKVVFVEDENDKENADGVKGHLEAVGDSELHPGFYDKYVKRVMDILLSFAGLVVLSPVYLVIAAAIKIEDPGPVLFTQKRVGQDKEYFSLHKFRSMKMSTPHDVPTHMLDDAEQYITKVGRFLRAHSLDELPQIWDIFMGNMSVIGPRPALWNQDLLIAERDKYGVNNVKPGLTGWAQINGRDELKIPDKAELDGEYVRKMGLLMDIRCFLGSVGVFAHDGSVVEGRTGETEKVARHYTDGRSVSELTGQIGFSRPVVVDKAATKKILITGAGSYIGESFCVYAEEHYKDDLEIDVLDMIDPDWRKYDLSQYDIVYHVAGIAHADVGQVDDAARERYYAVNTDLAVEVCEIAKKAGVKEFVFMSSMIVYGASAGYGKKKVIDRDTVPEPANFYGDSKLQADVAVRNLADENFTVVVLRPPMIYGKGSRGNYPMLSKLAKKMPVFPDVDNERSMLHIDNLCEFLCQVMLVESPDQAVVLIPQDREWTKTSQMVQEIAAVSGNRIKLLKILGPVVAIGGKIPGKIGGLVDKAFGNMAYDQGMSDYEGLDYRVVRSLREAIERTEGPDPVKRVLILASVASMIDQFNMPNIRLLQDMGYTVDVACNFEKGSTCTVEKIAELRSNLTEMGVMYYHIDFDRNVMNLPKGWMAYAQVKKIVKKNKYVFIHCHSPIGGVIARIVGRELGVKVIYTAHGFHFYDGAPKKNWMIYYPIEKLLSRWTDTLITINKEDFERAKKHLHAKKTVYIPGVGVDTEKFRSGVVDVERKRSELGVGEDGLLLLSVGELSVRKNHEVVIRALALLPEEGRKHIRYFICGQGELGDYLTSLAQRLNVDLTLLGFRTDITELCCAADLFVFPSKQEGLPVALMEAIACKTPVVCSDIRGNTDIVKENLFKPNDVEGLVVLLKKLFWNGSCLYTPEGLKQKLQNLVLENHSCLLKFDFTHVEEKMEKIYRGGVIRFEKLQNIIRRKCFIDKFGIPDNGVILLSVGELNGNKNHAAVIEALAQIKDDKLHYCIAGAGGLEDTLREMAKDKGVNLHLLGYYDNVPELMSIADVFVHLSFREGLPVALMEAMAAGLPVIASNIRGVQDLIDDGKGGYLVKLSVMSEIVYTIKKISKTSSVWKKMGKYNIRVIQDFDREKVLETMKKEYKEFSI